MIKKIFGFSNDEHGAEKANSIKFFNQSPNISSEGLTRYYYDNKELEQLSLEQMLSENAQND